MEEKLDRANFRIDLPDGSSHMAKLRETSFIDADGKPAIRWRAMIGKSQWAGPTREGAYSRMMDGLSAKVRLSAVA